MIINIIRVIPETMGKYGLVYYERNDNGRWLLIPTTDDCSCTIVPYNPDEFSHT